MAKQKKPDTEQAGIKNQFFEIVNWKRAQPRMKGGGNEWLKLYTSLLEHDGFCAMDELIVALWLYAARSGLHILPADPAWLARKIPMLNGEPTPFIRYCPPPKGSKGRSAGCKTKKSRKEVLEATKRKRIE